MSLGEEFSHFQHGGTVKLHLSEFIKLYELLQKLSNRVTK